MVEALRINVFPVFLAASPRANAVVHPPGILFLLQGPSSGYVWLDAENYFVRHPGDVLRVLGEDPVHACLESDVTRPGSRREDWWGIPLPCFVELMRAKGVRGRLIETLPTLQHDPIGRRMC